MASLAPARPIAVVTVCRNPGPVLLQALDSVRALADARTRHIVIDGASTDGTPAVLASAASSLSYWHSRPDGGIYDAMNQGWQAAPDDAWVIFIGADDRLLGLPTEHELAEFEREGCTLVFGTTNAGGMPFRSRFGPELRLRNTLHHQSLLVRKSAHPAPPFDARWRVYGDWDVNLRLWRSGLRATFSERLVAEAAPGGASAVQPLAETFAIARQHSGSAVAGIAWSMAAGSRTLRGTRRALRRLADRIGIRR